MSMAVGSGSRGVLLRFFSKRASGIQWRGGSGGLEEVQEEKLKKQNTEAKLRLIHLIH